MNSIFSDGNSDGPAPRAINCLLRFGALVVLLALMEVSPSFASAYYSSMTVGSNGTIYGWAVTDVTAQSMYHEAFVSVTLTSPNGRQDSLATQSDQNTVREDVSLLYDENDLGEYSTNGTHSAYCHFGEAWLFEDVFSEFPIFVRIAYATGKWTGVQSIVGGILFCNMTPACSYGVTPTCGRYGWLYATSPELGCPDYCFSGWIMWMGQYGSTHCLGVAGIGGPAGGPGYCD